MKEGETVYVNRRFCLKEFKVTTLVTIRVRFTKDQSSDCISNISTSLSKYLVDPASSHMLVSKIKPCMSKHMP
jgi:hypothetical protein